MWFRFVWCRYKHICLSALENKRLGNSDAPIPTPVYQYQPYVQQLSFADTWCHCIANCLHKHWCSRASHSVNSINKIRKVACLIF